MDKSVWHEPALIDSFRTDHDFAIAYLKDVLADGDFDEIKLAVSRVAEAWSLFPSMKQFGNNNVQIQTHNGDIRI